MVMFFWTLSHQRWDLAVPFQKHLRLVPCSILRSFQVQGALEACCHAVSQVKLIEVHCLALRHVVKTRMGDPIFFVIFKREGGGKRLIQHFNRSRHMQCMVKLGTLPDQIYRHVWRVEVILPCHFHSSGTCVTSYRTC